MTLLKKKKVRKDDAPRWPSKTACLRERHAAAFKEARANPRWPGAVRAGLRAPNHEAETEVPELTALRRKIAKCGPALLRSLADFRASVATLHELESHRRARREPAAIAAIDEAANLIELHARLARLETEGKSSPERKGRRRDPARARAARWTVNTGVFDWSPTARDLALLAICEGATDLPSEWARLTVAELIEREANAMRAYLTPSHNK